MDCKSYKISLPYDKVDDVIQDLYLKFAPSETITYVKDVFKLEYKLHNIYGPAVVCHCGNGCKPEYFIDGIEYSYEKWLPLSAKYKHDAAFNKKLEGLLSE